MSFSKILHKRNFTEGAVPDNNSLSAGEIAINTYDGKIFTKTISEEIKTFLNSEQLPFSLDTSLSAINTQYGGNTVSEVFASVLGGFNNDVNGAASAVINGENNDVVGDFSLIANGLDNRILSGGDFSFIAGGKNNLISHENVFTLGSNLSSHADNFTYVNNISATGKIYGDGSELEGIVAGDSEATTLVRSNSALWQGTYTTVLANSASWESAPINVILNSDPLKFVFIGDGSTTSYTVSGTAESENPSLIEVFVDNVRQEPTLSYTLSSEIVEFTEAPVLSSRIVIITPNVVEGEGGGGGDENVNTLVKANSASWDEAYTLVQANSAIWNPSRRHDFVEEDDYSISYAGLAPSSASESSEIWSITKITYTTSGSISATQYAESVAWIDRLIVEYN